MYRLYMDEYDNHNFSGNARHVSRNHLLAETAVMCLRAGIVANPLDTPDLEDERVIYLQCAKPYFYFAREVKRAYQDEMNKIRYTRLAGIITVPGGAYAVYNLRNEMPKWMGEGESKVLWKMYSMFYPLRDDGHPYKHTALIFGENYDIALSLLQEMLATKKMETGLFRAYHRIVFVPTDDFGVRLLRIVTSDNWQQKLLDSLFEPEQYISSWGGLQFNVLIDGIDTFCFLNGDIRNLFNFRDTILMRKEGLLPSTLIIGHKVICFPEQLSFVQKFFGDLADIFTVTMDDLERVLEIDRPSLIE